VAKFLLNSFYLGRINLQLDHAFLQLLNTPHVVFPAPFDVPELSLHPALNLFFPMHELELLSLAVLPLLAKSCP
jgi:hypothetical protein